MLNASVPTNLILSALPASDFDRLAPHLEQVNLSAGQILYEPNQIMEEVYFPNHAMICLVAILATNSTAEIGLVGNEGMVGLPVFLGGQRTTSQMIVQIGGSAIKLNADRLNQEFRRGGALQKRLLLYTQARLTQVSQITACKTHHPIEKRLTRWLLSAQDAVQQNQLPLTQRLIAEMLGVRRASITEAARVLQQSEMIRYSRGQITILNRPALESEACECYRLIKDEFIRLLERDKQV